MELHFSRLVQGGRFTRNLPLVGCWLAGCLAGVLCLADEGAFSGPTVDRRLMRHEDSSLPVVHCANSPAWARRGDGMMPHGYVLPSNTRAQTGSARAERAAQQQGGTLSLNRSSRQPGASAQPPARRRSATAILVARRAEEHIRYASALAERGAAYSARSEFIQVLRLVSQALDQENNTQYHSRAMIAGLRALREADDFACGSVDDLEVVDLAHCIARHRTPVLKDVDTTQITVMDALQQYHTFASQQLAAACGREPAGSQALYGLARLQPVLNVGTGLQRSTAETNAIALHQAALAVDSRNYMAANELGVLLARYGQMQAAQALLRQSLSIRETSEAWRNLAVVYRETGAIAAADQARRRGDFVATSLRGQTLGGAPESMVYWVDPATLADGSRATEAVGPAVAETPSRDEKLASPWPRKTQTVATAPDTGRPANPLEQFKSFFGLDSQKTAARSNQPGTTDTRNNETLR